MNIQIEKHKRRIMRIIAIQFPASLKSTIKNPAIEPLFPMGKTWEKMFIKVFNHKKVRKKILYTHMEILCMQKGG